MPAKSIEDLFRHHERLPLIPQQGGTELVTKRAPSGEVEEVTLVSDNHDFKTIVFRPVRGEVRVVAEFMETVG